MHIGVQNLYTHLRQNFIFRFHGDFIGLCGVYFRILMSYQIQIYTDSEEHLIQYYTVVFIFHIFGYLKHSRRGVFIAFLFTMFNFVHLIITLAFGEKEIVYSWCCYLHLELYHIHPIFYPIIVEENIQVHKKILEFVTKQENL